MIIYHILDNDTEGTSIDLGGCVINLPRDHQWEGVATPPYLDRTTKADTRIRIEVKIPMNDALINSLLSFLKTSEE